MHSENKEDMEYDMQIKEEQQFEENAKLRQGHKKTEIGND